MEWYELLMSEDAVVLALAVLVWVIIWFGSRLDQEGYQPTDEDRMGW